MECKWYNYVHEGGSFPVCFRPFGVFIAPDYPAVSTYSYALNPSTNQIEVQIEFGKYGQYLLASTDSSLMLLTGSLLNNPQKWRKLEFLRDFTDIEKLMYTGGTVWSFEWAKGSFEVEVIPTTMIVRHVNKQANTLSQFRADSYNHFICPSFPAHSHWKLEGDQVYINWDKYGEYDLIINMGSASMEGCKRGQPENWRKAKFIRSMGSDGVTPSSLDHAHSH